MNKGLTEEQKENLIENWRGSLRRRFGGLDFWRLSKKYKELRYTELATFIVEEIDWILQNNDNPDFQP